MKTKSQQHSALKKKKKMHQLLLGLYRLYAIGLGLLGMSGADPGGGGARGHVPPLDLSKNWNKY